jgi:HlyD family secretion protein
VSNARYPNHHRSIRRHLLAGGAAVLVLVGGIGGWATNTEISGAVIAPGQLVVDSNVKKIQHPVGGVVGELKVKDGDFVKEGDVVARLDVTRTRASLAIVTKALDELAARQARNEAERDGAARVSFPADLLARAGDPDVLHVTRGEQTLFELRRFAREGLKAQFREQIAQLEQQIQANVEQVAAKAKEIDWIQTELKGVRDLWKQHLVQFSRVTALERDAARLEGERGALIATIAQTRGRIAETRLKIIQVDEELRTEVGKDLAEIRGKKSELTEKRVAAEDQLKRTDLIAPQDGKVFQRTVHTIGGVIQAGEAIMLIVPDADALTVETKVAPHEIDRLHLGQQAVLRFTAFNQRTTPELNGEVIRIGADVSQDESKGSTYYAVRLRIPDNELVRLDGLKLVAGMPVEAFIQTSPRTVMSYLVKPLQDQITRAFRER